MKIEILYEDSDICVINKPSGVVVNDSNSTAGNTIQTWFKQKYSLFIDQSLGDSEFVRKGGVVHRLDKDTSGVLVLAKNESTYEGLKKQFVTREVEKLYLVMVHGQMNKKEGILATPIERNPNKKMRFFVGKDLSRTGITSWKVLNQNADYSFLEVKIMTGRTHQIRVHMKHLGHPVVADPLYGFAKKWQKDLEICPRLFLHANKLALTHPSNQKRLTFIAELPEELTKTYEKYFE